MHDVESFGLLIAAVGIAASLAIISNRLAERVRVPAPALFLVAAAVLVQIFPSLDVLSFQAVQRVVTIALVVILFDGGMHIGRRRFAEAAGPILVLGVIGTAFTAAAVAAAGHELLGLGWQGSLALGAALAATDPAVVFSVLGKREVAGRAGTTLEGESGANDPVTIALMVALLAATGSGWNAIGGGLLEFARQVGIGFAVGVAGGWLLLAMMRRMALPGAGLYSVRALAAALSLYGLATVAHGSGFLAVFVAGILIGDERAPHKADIERFHGALASLGELVAFAVLGLTIDLDSLDAGDWLAGLAMGALLTLVIRPIFIGSLLVPMRMNRGERLFIVWAGLKGAVPILLGTFAITAHVAQAQRLYDVIFVVVLLSVVIQGGLVPLVARALGVPMRAVEPEPWAFGVRLPHEPAGVHRFSVAAGSTADGAKIRDLPGEDVWISIVVRAGRLVPVSGETMLAAGDQVVLFAEPGSADVAAEMFA
jgi:cell volume regulation protein A